MARNERLSQFYADDKDIRDLITASPQAMTNGRILELARNRGIFLADTTEDSYMREEIIDYVSRLPFSWPELNALTDIVHPRPRTPRTTSERVYTDAGMDAIERAAHVVEKRRNEEGLQTLNVSRSGTTVHVRVKYTKVLTGKTRLLQREPHEVEVDIERITKPDGSFALVCRHDDPVAQAVTNDVLSALAGTLETAPKRATIDLGHVLDPSLRSKFFLDLMKSIEGYGRISDVSKVGVFRVVTEPTAAAAADDDDDDDNGESNDPEAKAAGERVKALAKSVKFQGADLLKTPEFQALQDKGFFIGEAVWVVDNDAGEHHRVEIEAKLKDHQTGRDFGYKVRGVFGQVAEDTPAKNKKKPGIGDRRALERAIEEAAMAAYEGVLRVVEARAAAVAGPEDEPAPAADSAPRAGEVGSESPPPAPGGDL